MTGLGDSEARGSTGADARYVRHSIFLAIATGATLFFFGGVRETGSWAWFVVAFVVALMGARRLDLEHGTGKRGHAPAERTDRKDEGFQLFEPDDASSPDRDSGANPDEVDYLRALRHEFRTPLNAVLGFSDVLLSGIDGEINVSQREDLEIIRASGIRLRVLLDSAFDMTQLAGGQLRLDVERVDMKELVSRAVGEATQLWSNKKQASATLPDVDCVTEADEARLRRSIVVLADFLSATHRDASIAVELTPSEGHLAIEITAEATHRPTLDALPTTAEVLAAEDATKIRQWPVAVTLELVGRHGGTLYHGSAPSRFLIRLPMGGSA